MNERKWWEMFTGEELSHSTKNLLKVGAHKETYISHVEKPDACRISDFHNRKGELQTCATHDQIGLLFSKGTPQPNVLKRIQCLHYKTCSSI